MADRSDEQKDTADVTIEEMHTDEEEDEEDEEEAPMLAETLPFAVDSLEDLEVEAINANAPPIPTIAINSAKNSTPSTVESHTQQLAKYLKQSVYELNALEDLDWQRSERFSSLYEDLPALDELLTEEFSNLELQDDWTLLGPFAPEDGRESLMHFASRFGLINFCKHLLTLPGGVELLDIPNHSGLIPSDIAGNESHTELANLLLTSSNKASSGSDDGSMSNTPPVSTTEDNSKEIEESVDGVDMASAGSVGFDANIDMLHQLIEEIETDRKAMNVEDSDTLASRRTYSGAEHAGLDSIPELSFNESDNPVKDQPSVLLDDVHLGLYDTNEPFPGELEDEDNTDGSNMMDSKNSVEEDDVDGRTSLIQPYSETSSGTESDSDDAPALPPRTWKRREPTAPLSISPIALGSAALATNSLAATRSSMTSEDSLPSITVSPPGNKTSVASMFESIQMARESTQEIEELRRNKLASDSAALKRFSTSCPSLENQGLYEGTTNSSVVSMQPRQTRGQYKSLLDVTQEENEDEVEADDCDTSILTRRPSGERPKSLDFSTLGAKLSIAGVTAATSSSDFDDNSTFADRNRKVSFNMFGGAKKEKTKFHQGVESAGKRSFSLGSLGSEDDEDDQRNRIRERSADSDGHVKPIDIYGAPLQKLPNVDFSKHMGQQSDGSTSSLHSTSQEQLNRHSLAVGPRHSHTRSALPLPQTTTNLNKSKSISTPSIHQSGDQSNRHSGLFTSSHLKVQHTTDSLRRTGATRRPLSQEPESSTAGPSNYDGEDDKSKKKGNRRTSVFAKFGSVRKTGKKDKNEREMKRANHNFIPVNLPNSTCNHCSKLLHYKSAVQCSNCLMNYHDECKDRVPSCPKQRRERKGPVIQSLGTQASRHDSGEGIMSPSIGDSYSPSMESLADDGNADDEYEDDPELAVRVVESESWSETIDKKVLKGLKAKYVQRQDNIWELIATEKQYCLNLKIMQKVFAHGMKNECILSDADIKRIFPELDELIELHQAFLSSLQQRQEKKADRSVDHIGGVIVDHFGGTTGERMKRAYGIFCSRHKEGIDYYKHLYKNDRKFQSFIKRVSNLSCTKRRGVQDLVTVVTMRMTKYKTLIENIIKNTKESKDKADRETLNKGLDLNKEILRHIDMSIHNRNQELRLIEIFNKMDARSSAVYDKIKKFKKSDLTAKSRKLRHEGVLYWRNAREKEVETLVVVLSDVMLFLQENDKKYSFFTQDNKPSVVPLTSLIVREKGSTKDNRGIYLIRQSRDNPEMYELVCKSSQDRKDWIDLLRKAVNESPEEDEGVINETEEEHREVIAKLGKLREYVETLDYKDKELEQFCRDRFSIIADIMQVYDYADVLQNIKSSYDDDGELKSASALIKLSLDEASMLASLYQTLPAATNLGRSWSSVGERQSPTYQQVPLPKRAETFNGFDQDIKSPATSTKTIFDKGDSEGRSPSLLNLQQDSDGEGPADVSAKMETSRNVSVNRRSSSNILHQILSSSSSGSRQEETDSGNDSLLTMSSMLAITAIVPPTKEQAQCVTQLNEYLHGILLVVNKQDSMLENMKQQLADVTVRSRRIEQEQEKKSALRHNKQMEEIRNRHEQLTKERAVLEAEKENLNSKLEAERVEMEELKADVANQQNELKKEREELQRQREALQKQIDFYQVSGSQAAEHTVTTSTSSSPHLSPQGSNAELDTTTNASATKSADTDVNHKRSHSAELVEFDNPQLFIDSKYSASLTEPLNMKEVRAQHFANFGTSPDRPAKTGSAGNLTKADRTSSQGSLKKTSNNNTVQQIPSKLVTSGTPTKSSTTSSNRQSKSMLPLNLAESSKKTSKNNGAKTPSQGKKGDVIYF